jgi:hypothetical protein
MSWRTIVCAGLLVAGCKKGEKKEPPPDYNKCDYPAHYERIDKKGVPPGFEGDIFGVGDTPEDSYTSLQGHVAPKCEFVEGPNLKKQADGTLATVAEGEVTGTRGSATSRYLVRKVAKLIPSSGTSIGGIGALSEPFVIEVGEGKERSVSAVRLDSCDRYISGRGAGNTQWKLGTCAGLVDAVTPEDLTRRSDSLYLKGLKAGTCELEMEAGGITAKFPLTVTGGAAGSADGSAAGSAVGSAAGSAGSAAEPDMQPKGGGGAPTKDAPKPTTRGAKMSSDPEEGGEKK